MPVIGQAVEFMIFLRKHKYLFSNYTVSMDKECSFLIILIITYLSYNYCSKTVEGIEAGLNALLIALAAKKSLNEKRAVNLDEDF